MSSNENENQDTNAPETAQNPMQPSIQGYRRFDQATSDSINEIKELGNKIDDMLNDALNQGADPRAISLARTNLQQGAMWWIRALAKPEGFF